MLQSKTIISVFVLSLVLMACGTKRAGHLEKLPKAKDNELMDALDSLSNQKFEHFYAKINTKYQDSSQRVSFKTSIRMREDSVVNALITYARIPIINALVSTDSIKISNKREKCYEEQSLDYIKNNFGVDFTYRNLEELFLGFPLGYDNEEKYFRVKDPYAYIICSHRKKQVQRIERKDDDEVIIYYILNEDLNQLNSMIVESPKDTTTIKVDYLTRMEADGFQVPNEMKVVITTPRQEINIEMEYSKARIGEKEEIYFVIPEGYDNCGE